MDALLFGALSGALFGAFAVAIRAGLSRGVPAATGATISSLVGLVVVLIAALASGAFSHGADARDVLIFGALGAGVPGLSSIAFVLAIRYMGAARAAVLVGVAPLASFVLATAFLGEHVSAGLVAGAALIVAGGASLSLERQRPDGFRALGAVLATSCALLFAIRDTLVRWASGDATIDPLVRAVVSLAAASLVLLAWSALRRRAREPSSPRSAIAAFAPAGICLGSAYLCLLVALDRGRVTIVAPLNASQSLWGVIFAAAFLGKREQIGSRLVVAAALVVAGGVLIGINR